MRNVVPLGDIVDIMGGGTPSRLVKDYWDGPIPWATVKDFKSITLDSTLESITPQGVKYSATNIVPAGAVIVPTRMAVGKAAINAVDLAINQDLKAILPRNNVDQRFLLHFLLSQATYLEGRAQGATVKGIKLDLLRSLPFPRLPLDEQCRIARILDKADAIRRKRERTLALADGLLKSAFLEMFGDPAENPNRFKVEKIEHHLSKKRLGTQSGPFGSALKKHEYTNTGIPVWGVSNVQANRFLGKAELFISEKKYEQLRRYSVCCGDVLISRAGTVGRMCIARPIVEQSIIGTNLIRVSLDPDSLLSEYFVALFTYLPHRLEALKANEKKSAFTFLNPRKLKGIEIPIPPKALQKDYRTLVNKVESLTRQGKNHLEGLDELFGSLSQRAFDEKL